MSAHRGKPGFRQALLNGAGLALPMVVGIANPASAQEEARGPGSRLEEIVVTAQKRPENILDVPISVSALDNEKVGNMMAGGQDINSLAAQVPGFVSSSSNGRLAPRFFVRGAGNTAFDANASQPVSMIYDDVVLENVSIRSFPLFDIQSVELLRGPQGTLFGRNATAGAIKIDSAAPTDYTTGHVDVSWGQWQTRSIDAAVGGKLTDTLNARVSFYHAGRADWIDNIATGLEKENAIGSYGEVAARLKLEWKPAPETSVLLNAGYHNMYDDTGGIFRAGQFAVGGDIIKIPRDKVALDGINFVERSIEQFYTTATVRQGLGSGLDLTSITSYRKLLGNRNIGDVDGGSMQGPIYPGNIPSLSGSLGENWSLITGDNVTDHYQLTEEARISSDWAGPFNFLVGGYFFRENLTVDQVNGTTFSNFSTVAVAPAPLATQRQKTSSWALFTSLDYDVSSDTSLKFGLRYSKDTKNHYVRYEPGTSAADAAPDSPYYTHTSDDALTGDLSIVHSFTPDMNVYARVATGYKESAVLARENIPTVAAPERIWNYEVGVKSELLDGMLRFNLSAFYYTYDNYQAVLTGGEANNLRIFNIDRATGKGFELETEFAPAERVRVNLGVAYSDTKIDDTTTCVSAGGGLLDRGGTACPSNPAQVMIDGGSLPGPRWTANGSLYAGQPVGNGEAYFQTNWAYKGRAYPLIPVPPVENFDAPWLRGNASIGYRFEDDRFDVSFFVNNITNLYYAPSALNFFNYRNQTLTAQVSDPRTWGLRLRHNF
ncbi:TonB-dependent receptor [Novosphingobium profundi]|uniref:TonB-dependent receptor n=1 Tax=Novosphingobium profundi TaxID=1774954 RepID=UPI001CFECD67|nr:TonB-dependent receptor [Novosphingobium profundi]